MARPRIDDKENLALWRKTAHRLRLIGRLTGRSMMQVADIASQKLAEEYKDQIAIFEKISKGMSSDGQEN